MSYLLYVLLHFLDYKFLEAMWHFNPPLPISHDTSKMLPLWVKSSANDLCTQMIPYLWQDVQSCSHVLRLQEEADFTESKGTYHLSVNN